MFAPGWKATAVGNCGDAENPEYVYNILTSDGFACVAEYVNERDSRLIEMAPTMRKILVILANGQTPSKEEIIAILDHVDDGIPTNGVYAE